MLPEIRNTEALFYLIHELSDLRASFIQFGLERDALPSDDKWQKLEQEIKDDMRQRYFKQSVTDALYPDQKMSAEEDFETRTTRLTADPTAWITHDILKSIPFHGHPDYRERR